MHHITILKKSLYWMVLIVAGSFLLGGAASYFWFTSHDNDAFHSIRSSSSSRYKFISPLIECEPNGQNMEQAALSSLGSSLSAFIKSSVAAGNIANTSVYFRNLNNGPWFGIEENANFYPASLLKVPLMFAILKMAEVDHAVLDYKVLYSGGAEVAEQYFKPQEGIKINQVYTINELLRRMIENSDNNAAALLADFVGKDKMSTVYTDLGLVPFDFGKDGVISVKDYASFFRVLFNAAYLDKELSEYALKLLSNSEFQQGIVAGLPRKLEVADKFGERALGDSAVKQLHDCGIVYYPNHPYLLCIMTRGNDFNVLANAIADISKITYQYMDNLYR